MVSNSSDSNDRSSANSSAVPLAAGTMLQEFEIERLVGIGGFGIVYLANDTLLHRRVAIKEYMPTATAARFDGVTVSVRSHAHQEEFETGKRSFINEARMLARFKHPSLLEVFRFWEQHGTAYMAMPFYEGITLKESVKANGPVQNEAQLRSILDPLLDVLEYMHQDSVYHRDIAPDNIMLLTNGRPVLLDLGAARTVAVEGGSALTVLVKPGYAPVEQYADDASVRQGPWTDIYALGAVSWFSIKGFAPPPSASRMLRDGMAPLAGSEIANFSHECLEGLDVAMRIRPEDRPQNVSALKEALGWHRVGAKQQVGYGIETVKRDRNDFVQSPIISTVLPSAEPVVAIAPKSDVAKKVDSLAGEPIAPSSEKTEVRASYTTTQVSDPIASDVISHAPEKLEKIIYEDLSKTVVVAKKEVGKSSAAMTANEPNSINQNLSLSAPQANKPNASKETAVSHKKGRTLQMIVAGSAVALSALALVFLIKPTDQVRLDSAKSAPELPLKSTGPAVETPATITADATERAPALVKSAEAPLKSDPVEIPPNLAPNSAPSEAVVAQAAKINDVKPAATAESTKIEPVNVPEPESIKPVIVRLNVKPWGEVFVNGKSRVVSPPNKVMSLPPGDYSIEIKNMDNPSASFKAKLTAGDQFKISHDFTTGKSVSAIVKATASSDGNLNPKSAVVPPASRPATGAGPY
jgi:non-specific serine/threonine protein kinase